MFVLRCNITIFICIVLIYCKSIDCDYHSNNLEYETNETRKSFDTLIREHVNLMLASDDCNCGVASRGCYYQDGKKICLCDPNFVQDGGQCRYCNCGPQAIKCAFENGKQKCVCLDGYSQSSSNLCERCNCGEGSKTCEFVRLSKKCTCSVGFEVLDGVVCARCDCGTEAKKCEFVGLKKICTCSDGYSENWNTCERCDCGSESLNCSFDSNGHRKCVCGIDYISKKPYSWIHDEECVSKGTPSWKIAIYVVSAMLVAIIIGIISLVIYKKRWIRR